MGKHYLDIIGAASATFVNFKVEGTGGKKHPYTDTRLLRIVADPADDTSVARIVYSSVNAAENRAAILRNMATRNKLPVHVNRHDRQLIIVRCLDGEGA